MFIYDIEDLLERRRKLRVSRHALREVYKEGSRDEGSIRQNTTRKVGQDSSPLRRSQAGRRSPPSPTRRPGRNDPCWCGSGKKYKHCHMRQERDQSE